jgi:2-keto-3-deoxy-L-fuconate dehydrogenase
VGEFDGIRALVTGAASGIGLATARLLAQRGAQVASLDLDVDLPEPVFGVRGDVTDDASVREGVRAAADRLAAADDPEAERAALDARQPTGRLVTAAEVAGAVAYLASPTASATTGMALAVDGGMDGLQLRPRPISADA